MENSVLYFKILGWYGDRLSCPYENSYNAYVQAKMVQVEYDEERVIVHWPVFRTDSSRLPFTVLDGWAEMTLPEGAREISRAE